MQQNSRSCKVRIVEDNQEKSRPSEHFRGEVKLRKSDVGESGVDTRSNSLSGVKPTCSSDVKSSTVFFFGTRIVLLTEQALTFILYVSDRSYDGGSIASLADDHPDRKDGPRELKPGQ